MKTWFTSDEHFGHKNIITYSKRPFRDMEEMQEELVRRHNALVRAEDRVWHLGDFALDDRLVPKFLSRLNGHHLLVAGNHDKCHPCHRRHIAATAKYERYGFEGVNYWAKWSIPRLGDVLLTHMPPTYGDLDPRYPEHRPSIDTTKPGVPDIILHGHVHERWRAKVIKHVLAINVGVDQWSYAPVSENELAAYVASNFTQWLKGD